MNQKSMLKSDILKILASDISGGRRGDTQPVIPGIISNKDPGNRPTFESAKNPKTFFGGQSKQPNYPSAQEPSPAANPMTPIVPSIISDKKPGSRPTYKSAKTPKTFFGGTKEKCAKANQDVVKFCAEAKKPKSKRAPSAYNLFVKKYFAERLSTPKESTKETQTEDSSPRRIKETRRGKETSSKETSGGESIQEPHI